MLQDNFGRQFEYLRLSITDVCNFSCNYCLPDGYQGDSERSFLTLPEIETLVTAFAQLGMKKIRITGGEPALRKDLSDVIRLCKNTEGIEKVALTTNGYNLSRRAQELVDAGLDAINISIDSLDPRLFHSITGQDKLQQILHGIDLISAAGLSSIKLNAVLLKQFNLAQLSDYLNWIKDKPLTVRFIELMQTGDNKDFFKENHVNGSDIKQQLLAEGWGQILRNKLSGPAEEFYHPEHKGKIGLIMPYSKDFCTNCNRLRMSAVGKLHLCLFAEQGIDIRPYLKTQDVGATKEALVAALTDKTASHELQQGFTGATTHLAMLGG